MARRDNPHARCTTEIPPKPKLTASLAAIMRRVRSSKSGHTERNFCINSDRVLMLRKHTTITHKLIPLFIYTALQENYIFFVKELSRIDDEIRNLPRGSISAKKIGKTTYYYHQWREGKKVKSVSLGAEIPPVLLKSISRRKLLERQIKEISKEITIIAKAIDTQRVTVDDIIKVFSQNGIRVILI